MYFTCGCCGVLFNSTFEKQTEFDQDVGFGICPRCEKEQIERNEQEWQKLISLISKNLNSKNRKDFESMSKAAQKGIVLKLMEKGCIKWKIG